MKNIASIPMRCVGPIKIVGNEVNDAINVPLATFETPLWPSVARGARISRLCGGIAAAVVSECMTRSVLVEAVDAVNAAVTAAELLLRTADFAHVIEQTSRYTKFKDLQVQVVGNLLYLRLAVTTGDAAGHNMVTKAADALLDYILAEYPQLSYVSISGNYCTDKKASAVNGILGRGKYVVADIKIAREICVEQLRATPEQIVALNIKKNLIGTTLAGGIRSANAHFANILLGMYLATGQDAANIIEGSQGMVHAEVRENDLYFSVTLPNVIVGTVGSGKDHEFVRENLQALGCLEQREIGANARRLAIIIAAAVLCGELSLLAAQTNRHELMRSHEVLERA